MLHPICFLPTLYTDTDMSIFGMVIVLAFQICILLMGFTASFSKGTQQYESWHEFPIDLLYKDVSSLDTKWRILASCPNSVVVVLRSPIHANEPSEYNGMLYRTSNTVLNNGIKVIILICMDGTSQYHHHPKLSVID